MKRATTIHRKDAFRLLEDRRAHNLRLWKLSTGDILEYEGAVCVGGHKRGGTHRVRLPRSGVLREFRDISLFEIDGLKIYWRAGYYGTGCALARECRIFRGHSAERGH